MKSLPTGTVTFLFTDIEGSTVLLQRLGDRRYAEVLEEHHRLLRAVFAAGNGQEVSKHGDAFLVAFSRAREAVATALAAQRSLATHAWPDGASLRVRMGLHTGEAVSGSDDYAGLDVHRASRICSVGHGGQILVSQAVEVLITPDLPPGVSLRDLGTHRLKDLREPEHLFQVMHPDLRADFPLLRSLSARPNNNLPVQLTTFVGRTREISEVKRLLSDARLVTLTGSGGAGKTRLALRVAADVLYDYPDGAWLVDFAPITDPALVPKTVTAALGVPERAAREMLETLVDALRSKALLLILDNCEHLLAACAELAVAVLRACPHVRLLATGREGLWVPGESVWPVPSLSLPDARRVQPPEDLVRYEAVQLFVERAKAIAPGFTVTSENAPALAQVCERLDGIPLAIELAAARVKVLTVAQIAARLHDRFRLLTGGGRSVLPRHQTLQATMDWSYGLLSEQERTLLRRLSVFAGGWTLDAAEKICSADTVERSTVLDLLAQLVDKSLVTVAESDREARYSLLETVRQYAGTKLAEVDDEPGLQRRHGEWCLRLAEDLAPQLSGAAMSDALVRLEREHDNLRAALEWSGSLDGNEEVGLRLAVALARFWEMRGHVTEGRRWLEIQVAHSRSAPPYLRAAALNAAGSLAYRQGDYERVSTLCSEALALSNAHGDRRGAGRALHFLAHLRQARGEHADATEMMARSVALHREAGDAAELANSVDCLGEIARGAGDYERARIFAEEALKLYGNLGHVRGKAHVLHNLAYVRLHEGKGHESQTLFRESLALAREVENTRDEAFAVVGLACASLGDVDPGRVARLLGAAEALLRIVEVQLEPAEDAEFRGAAEIARKRLDPAAFAAAWAEGRAMTLEQAIEYALAADATAAPTTK